MNIMAPIMYWDRYILGTCVHHFNVGYLQPRATVELFCVISYVEFNESTSVKRINQLLIVIIIDFYYLSILF